MQTRQANTAYTLADVFRGMTLSEMQATAYDMSLPIPSKLRKAEYQEAIIHAIPEHIGDFLLRLARYELELLDQLVLIGSGKALIVPTLSINSALIANHIIQVEFLRNEHADCFTLSDELRPHIAQCLPAILNDPDRKPFDRLMQYAFGITNLYGALDYKKGMDMIVFRGMIDLDKPEARLLFKRFINSGFFLQCSQETIQNGKENQYFTSALMYELEPVLAETKARKKLVKRYNDFSDEEILAAGEFPYIRLMCDGYEELRKLLRAEFRMSDEQVRGTIQNLWVLLQYTPNPFHILQEILPPISSIDQLQKLAPVVMRFSNNSPRWILKGFSPSEVNNL